MQEFTLFHPEFGRFTSDNNVMIDRKLAMGFKFIDEVEILKDSEVEKIKEIHTKKRGRPPKDEKSE